MRYEGMIYRPPSEAYSLIVQVTIGCSHNKCTFCNMFREKKFRVRNVNEVLEDLDTARRRYSRVGRIFLADGDALVLTNEKLMVILNHINKNFPECERVTIYGTPQDVLRKSHEELVELRENGLEMIYIGAESGSDKVLKDICKGATRAELIEAVQKIEAAGIKASVTFINGMGGRADWKEHAIETGTMISEMNASYVSLLTLMVERNVPLYEKIQSGEFEMLSAEEVAMETLLMLEHANVDKKCIFRSNHASNYVSLKGDLPEDRDMMMNQLRYALKNANFKDDRFRML